ncbi:hypothetical protein C5Y96_11790 [Blastopirellula marina]|uniref:Uncharacterized protein n=1 Tax=Blastopirellula marina TaxID=124 RepID=A0A2S8FGJ8_9BACT|nr:hypothetical protein C5Y96_11790 [Blastopirellula marina]RCS51428.1 hypothetical protein DTL36_11800 [Bremerella cremea]
MLGKSLLSIIDIFRSLLHWGLNDFFVWTCLNYGMIVGNQTGMALEPMLSTLRLTATLSNSFEHFLTVLQYHQLARNLTDRSHLNGTNLVAEFFR